MRLQEYLFQLDKKEIEVICINLEAIDKNDMNKDLGKKYMIDLIVRDRLLNSKYLYAMLDNKLKVKFDDDTLRDIQRITFGISIENEKSIELFRECGLIFNKNQVPEDLRTLLIDKYRKEFIVNLEDPIIYNKQTPLLKLILFTSRIYQDGKIMMNTKKSSKYKYIKLINSYLLSKNLVRYVENKYMSLNIDKYYAWASRKKDIIKEFYEYVFENNNQPKIKELFYRLMSIQGNENEWIDFSKIQCLMEEYEEEITYALDIGLILQAKDDKEYIQLNNEVWSMFNRDIFNEWNNSQIIITPDFEVFISYKDDPLLILILSLFGKLQNEISNNDYFLVFDISSIDMKNSHIGNYTFDDFFESLKIHCNDIPDLVNEQLMKSLN
ncbi:hypothetical protein ACN077_17055 [Clostridium chromiireducens]|uniref:hypothetical protein n=1 Tax=Clostridium chromiireducens TaxID=225345 RepID=UPI003AF5F114